MLLIREIARDTCTSSVWLPGMLPGTPWKVGTCKVPGVAHLILLLLQVQYDCIMPREFGINVVDCVWPSWPSDGFKLKKKKVFD